MAVGAPQVILVPHLHSFSTHSMCTTKFSMAHPPRWWEYVPERGTPGNWDGRRGIQTYRERVWGRGGGYEADQLPRRGPRGGAAEGGALPKDPAAAIPPSAPLPASREGPLRLPESRLEPGRSRGKEAPAQSAASGRRESRQRGRGSWGRARWSRGLCPQRRLGARCTP